MNEDMVNFKVYEKAKNDAVKALLNYTTAIMLKDNIDAVKALKKAKKRLDMATEVFKEY